MAATLSEDTRLPLKLVLTLGGIIGAGLIAFMDVKADVRTLREAQGRTDTAVGDQGRAVSAVVVQVSGLVATVDAVAKNVDEMKKDVRLVKQATVPGERVVRVRGDE